MNLYRKRKQDRLKEEARRNYLDKGEPIPLDLLLQLEEAGVGLMDL